MLIAFEGQDGAGKTSLLEAVHAELTRRQVAAIAVAEFSASEYGQRLLDAVARDKFLRPTSGASATFLTRALEEITDLYYLDERVIAPAIGEGKIVLKDRHYDTILYGLAPLLTESGAVSDTHTALSWLRQVMSHIRHMPAIAVYVDAPVETRLMRITHRPRTLVEDRAHAIDEDDLRVFALREQIARQLIREEGRRFLVVDNTTRPLANLALEVCNTLLRHV